ncbi:site-specific integrase [Acidisoma cellulosilytica]|uniref:Site-specific integrase n=1 Tax=Acidisoma cellulosilyticum TaxID=2802395 RepID=A0A964E383_9PROT|nr:site-specific integrase [Acidisoma cellulosilyticum]MCB8880186.1 site-specific integrase [Acidisoma cellulosilyticum]
MSTTDKAEALKRWPSALKWWEERQERWGQQMSLVSLRSEDIEAVVTKWREWALYDPSVDRSDFRSETLTKSDTDPGLMYPWPPQEVIERHVAKALQLSCIAITDESMEPLELAMARAILLERDWERLNGSKLTAHSRGHRTRPLPFQPAEQTLTLDDLFKDWEAVTTVKASTKAETRYAIDAMATAVGHREARKVTRDDLRRWRDAIKAGGITNNTWNNRLSLIGQVFRAAVEAGKLTTNPADNDLRLKKSKNAERHPYSDEDAVKILEAARLEARKSRRWAPWIMAFSGMRVAEALQFSVGDIRQDRETSIWFYAINEDDPGKSVKSGQRRHVPIHPAVIAEGLLSLIEGRDKTEALFPDKKADAHGNRGGKGWQVLGRWVRETVGITDPKKAPNHSWRHRMEDELRAAEIHEEDRDAIVGHARKTVGRSYGVRGVGLRRLYAAVAKVPNPMVINPAVRDVLDEDAS